MRSFFIWCLSIIFIGFIIFIVYTTVSKLLVQREVKQKNSVLHKLPIVSLDSLDFSFGTQPRPIVILLFNSTCEHCQNEILALKKSINYFSGTSLVFISSEPLLTIKTFSTSFGLSSLPNIHFCKINPEDMYESFGSISFPHFFVYNKDHKLIKEFKGEVKIETIYKCFQ